MGSRSTAEWLLREENPGNRKLVQLVCAALLRESTRGSTSGCFHILEWKNKLIYFPRPRKSSSTAC